MFQHAAARRRLVARFAGGRKLDVVSTRSRPKAAEASSSFYYDSDWFQHAAARRRLRLICLPPAFRKCFNTQPPEGGCFNIRDYSKPEVVSTRSRPKAAGLRAAGAPIAMYLLYRMVSTRSRPKAAGLRAAEPLSKALFHQASQPRFR